MTIQRHIIRSKQFHFQAGDETEARRWHKVIGTRVNNADFLDRLSRRLDDVIPADRLIQLDRLEIRMPLNEVNFEEKLLEAIEKGLKPYLSGAKPNEKGHEVRGRFEALQHYLRLGVLPWWASHETIQEAVENLAPKEVRTILKLFIARPSSISRFARLVQPKFIFTHFLSSKERVETTKKLIQVFENVFPKTGFWSQAKAQFEITKALIHSMIQVEERSGNFRTVFISQLLQRLEFVQQQSFLKAFGGDSYPQTKTSESVPQQPGNSIPQDALQAFENLPAALREEILLELKSILDSPKSPGKQGGQDKSQNPLNNESAEKTSPNLQETDLSKDTEENNMEEIENETMDKLLEEGIFVRLAGLILLHPYLAMLFEKMELLEEKAFSSPGHQQKAVQMLGWLATGQDDLADNDLVMAKVLAGFPLSDAFEIQNPLNEKEKELGMGLLQAVIQHWTAIGNSSIEGLRGSFLVREGKLTQEEQGLRLVVERKAFDILLEKLPWGFGIAKLPWCEQTIFTDWN